MSADGVRVCVCVFVIFHHIDDLFYLHHIFLSLDFLCILFASVQSEPLEFFDRSHSPRDQTLSFLMCCSHIIQWFLGFRISDSDVLHCRLILCIEVLFSTSRQLISLSRSFLNFIYIKKISDFVCYSPNAPNIKFSDVLCSLLSIESINGFRSSDDDVLQCRLAMCISQECCPHHLDDSDIWDVPMVFLLEFFWFRLICSCPIQIFREFFGWSHSTPSVSTYQDQVFWCFELIMFCNLFLGFRLRCDVLPCLLIACS